MPKSESGFSYVLVLLLLLLLAIPIGVYLVRQRMVLKPEAIDNQAPQKLVLADFYYHYPWNGPSIYIPQWIQLNLGSNRSISQIKLTVAQTPAGSTDHRVFMGAQDNPGQLVKEFKGSTKDKDVLTATFSQAISNVQFIKVETVDSPSWVAWYEIQIYDQNNQLISQGTNAIASHSLTNSPPQNALDGNLNTLWNAGGTTAKNINGLVDQSRLLYQFSQPIPAMKSPAFPDGQTSEALAISWFKGQFERAASSGIDVIAIMAIPANPDPDWSTKFSYMLQAEKQLKAEGKKFPKLTFNFDAPESWNANPDYPRKFSSFGPDFNAIWAGIKKAYDGIFNNLATSEINDFILTYPDNNTFPFMMYRLEGYSYLGDITTDDAFVTQLKTNFSQTYPGKKVYVVLDDLWCATYGPANHVQARTCNADNYYHWGGAAEGVHLAQHSHSPYIISVGPGYDDHLLRRANFRIIDRQNGVYFTQNLALANDLKADWILLETFNFGEEGTLIDATNQFGNQYLDLTRNYAANWKSTVLIKKPASNPGAVRGNQWFLRNSNSTGNSDISFIYGLPADKVLVCDWNGDGVKTPAVFRDGFWSIKNSNSTGNVDLTFQFGLPGDIPICGDWTGKGYQSPGLVRSNNWFLKNSNSQGNADIVFTYGLPTDKPVVGDWDGDGKDTAGVFRSNQWLLRNSNTSGSADASFLYGIPSDTPIVGDWTGKGFDSVGVVRGNQWFLRNSNSTGNPDISFIYGNPEDVPVAGNWNQLKSPASPFPSPTSSSTFCGSDNDCQPGFWCQTIDCPQGSVCGRVCMPKPSPPPPKPGSADLNGDGKVDLKDFSILINKWGTGDTQADLNGDGKVNVPDLRIMLSQLKI